MGKRCAVIGCTNSDRDFVRFFLFPSALKQPFAREIWIRSLGRRNFQPKEWSYVCSDHFWDGEPTEENPYPMLRIPAVDDISTECDDGFNHSEPLRPLNFRRMAGGISCRPTTDLIWQQKTDNVALSIGAGVTFLTKQREGNESLFSTNVRISEICSDNVSSKEILKHPGRISVEDDDPCPAIDAVSSNVTINNNFDESCSSPPPIGNTGIASFNPVLRSSYVVQRYRDKIRRDKHVPVAGEEAFSGAKQQNSENVENHILVNDITFNFEVPEEIYTNEHNYCSYRAREVQKAPTPTLKYVADDSEIEILPCIKEQPETVDVPSDDDESCSSVEECSAENIPYYGRRPKTSYVQKTGRRFSSWCTCRTRSHSATVSRIRTLHIKRCLIASSDPSFCFLCSKSMESLKKNLTHTVEVHLNNDNLLFNDSNQNCQPRFCGYKEMQVLVSRLSPVMVGPLSADLSHFNALIRKRTASRSDSELSRKQVKNFGIKKRAPQGAFTTEGLCCKLCSKRIWSNSRFCLVKHYLISHVDKLRDQMNNSCLFCETTSQECYFKFERHIFATHCDDIYQYNENKWNSGSISSVTQEDGDLCSETELYKDPNDVAASCSLPQEDFLSTNFNLQKRDRMPNKAVNYDKNSYWQRRSRRLYLKKLIRSSKLKSPAKTGTYDAYRTATKTSLFKLYRSSQTGKKPQRSQKKSNSATKVAPTTSCNNLYDPLSAVNAKLLRLKFCPIYDAAENTHLPQLASFYDNVLKRIVDEDDQLNEQENVVIEKPYKQVIDLSFADTANTEVVVELLSPKKVAKVAADESQSILESDSNQKTNIDKIVNGGQTYSCQKCSISLQNRDMCKRHIVRCLNLSENKLKWVSWKNLGLSKTGTFCKWCSESFTDKEDFKNHLRQHSFTVLAECAKNM